jgi:hypothetical protein
MGLLLAFIVFVVTAWPVSLYWAIEDAFVVGFEQGYEEGQQRALMAPESFETCTKWWFDGSESRAKQAMNQYCDRRKK